MKVLEMWRRRGWEILALLAFASFAFGQSPLHLSSSPTARRICAWHNESRLEEHLNQLLVPRVSGSAGNSRVRDYIVRFLRGLWGRDSVELDSFSASTPVGPVSFANIIATAHPDAPQRIVLACHYDSKLMRGSPGREFLGATDSAFPCAAMLRLAEDVTGRLLRRRNPSTTLQLLFFDGEEAFQRWSATDSLYGSTHLAELWSEPGRRELDKMKVFILLDLLGAGGSRVPSTNFGRESRDYFDRLLRSQATMDSNGCLKGGSWLTRGPPNLVTYNPHYRFGFNRGVSGGIQDDHIPFFQAGMNRILHLIASPFPSVWHRLSDDRSALDAQAMADVLAVLRHFLVTELRLPV